jgi:Ca2+:H+ antiporter
VIGPVRPAGVPCKGFERVNDLRKIALRLLEEWPLLVNLATTQVFLIYGKSLLADLSHPVWFTLILSWLLLIILFSVFAVVRHAECLAEKLGEPLGTLVLTLAVTGIEVMIIIATMSTGTGSTTLARDAMFAVIMIVLNGMVGLTLLIGALRYHEQDYNLQGANAFLAVILPLSVIGLVLPNYVHSSSDQTFSPIQAVFLTLVSVALYGIFLVIQMGRHRAYFRMARPAADATTPKRSRLIVHEVYSVPYHLALLLAYMGPLVILTQQLAVPIDFTIGVLGAPVALAGFLVAMLVLAPESFAALRAALANDLQRSVNVLLGSALATIGLTIPAVLIFGLLTRTPIILGLDAVDVSLLALTLVLSNMTFTTSRSNVLLGAVHLLVFFAYLLLIFQR